MEPVSVTSRIALFDVVELTEKIGDVPVGSVGGVLDLTNDGSAMLEITSEPGLGSVERIVFAPLESLRVRETAHQRTP
jgi:hypothetical protein